MARRLLHQVGVGVLLLALAQCGGAAEPARNEMSPAGAPATTAATSSGGSAGEARDMAPRAQPTSEEAAPPPTRPSNGADEQMTHWQQQLDDSERALSSVSDCRDICRASGDICVAAHEICGLTGDGDNASPMDGRCTRARVACEQARRQRDGSCPACPQ